MNNKLYIFDLDGTIIINSDFYVKIYTETLLDLVKEHTGTEGLKILKSIQSRNSGKAWPALIALNIPFKHWAEKIDLNCLDMIKGDPELVSSIRNLKGKKVLYTGSPSFLVRELLLRTGLETNDFDLIIAWEDNEVYPLKWSCSPYIFKNIAEYFSISPAKSLSIGDTWRTDLAPAKVIGIRTASIRHNNLDADCFYESIPDFVKSIK